MIPTELIQAAKELVGSPVQLLILAWIVFELRATKAQSLPARMDRAERWLGIDPDRPITNPAIPKRIIR